MAQKLYVGNLAFSMTSEELGGLFGEHGNVVSAKVITERETGRTPGSAHDTVEWVQLAQRAEAFGPGSIFEATTGLWERGSQPP